MELSQAELITARKRSLGQGNVFTPVCDSVHGGVSTPLHAAPPRADTPGQTHPPPQILRDTVNMWAVRILMKCILV